MSLPTPTGRQKEVLYLPAEGHIAVLGTAGSGKTTLAILRSTYLADPDTSHNGRTLLLTYNKALVTYLKYLQDQKTHNLVVENYHLFARGYLNARGRMKRNGIADPELRESLIENALDDVREKNPKVSILNRENQLFSEEFNWIARHGITSAEEYRDVERVGRSGARIPRKDRDLVFDVYDTYKSLRANQGKDFDWDDLAISVCEEFQKDSSPRRYKHIVIDEGQDFSPAMIRSLTYAIPEDGSLTFFGDVAQQIYGHRMTWRSAGLKIEKVWDFRENYRNSRQIAKLGLAISKMPYFQGVADLVEPVTPSADGPLPTIVSFASRDEEIKFVVKQAQESSENASVAVLFRDRDDEKQISKFFLRDKIRLHRDLKAWISGSNLYYGTYHAAKGLEFDMVILPFFDKEHLPAPGLVKNFGQQDALSQDGRLLYVGITRAKTRLVITHTGEITDMLPRDESLYRRLKR